MTLLDTKGALPGERQNLIDQTRLMRISFVFILLVIAISIAGLLGWGFDILFLIRPVAGAAAMNPLTSVNFILFAGGVFLTLRASKSNIVLVVIAVVCFCCTYKLLDLLLGFSFHIDQVLFKDKINADAFSHIPSRMAVNTCVNFMVLSFCLLSVRFDHRARVHQIAALPVIISAGFAILGYLYKVPEFFGGLPYFPMAPVTAVSFVLLASSILLLRPGEGIIGEFTGTYSGRLATRYLMPLVVVLPVFVGYIRMWGHWRSLFSTEFGVTMIIATFTTAFAVIVWQAVAVLNRRDRLKEKYEEELRILNKEVNAANEEMATLNEEMTASNEELLSSNEELTIINERLEEANQTIAKQKDEQLNRVLDSSNDAIWSFDLTGHGENYLSRSAEKIYGEPLTQLIQRPYFWLEYLHPDDKQIKEESQERLKQSGFTECTYRIILSDGIHWMHDRLRLIRDKDGKDIRLEGIASDVTEIKKQEYELHLQRENLDIIFSNSTDHFILIDAERKIVFFNRTYERFSIDVVGIRPRPGMHFLDVIPPNRREASSALMDRAMKGETISTEAKVTGSLVKYYHARYMPVIQDGKVTHVTICSTDITERKAQEVQLAESEANLRSIVNSTLDGFLLLNSDCEIIAVNDSYREMMTGILGNFRVGRSIFELLPEERHTVFQEYLDRVREGHTVKYHASRQKDSLRKWFDVTMTPVQTDKEEFLGYCITTHDITAEKQAEEAIRASEERYRALVEYSNDVTSIIDFNGNVLFTSTNISRILGYEGLVAYENIIHPDDRELFERSLASFANTPGKSFPSTIRVMHKDGNWRWMEGMSSNLSHIPSIKGIVSTHHDITEKRMIEEKLDQNQYFLDKAAEAANIGYWTSEPDTENGRVTWSQEVYSIFEMDTNEFDGKASSFYQLVHPEDREKVAEVARISLHEGQIYNVDHRIQLKNGRSKWVNERARILRNEKGEPTLMVGIVQDINDRKIIEQVLREYNDRHEILNRATNDIIWDWDVVKDKCVYNQAMQSVLGYSESTIELNIEWLRKKIHPDDHDRVIAEVKEVFAKQLLNWESSYRYLNSSGAYLYIHDRAYVVYGKNGEALRMIGAMQDTTELTEYRVGLEKKVEERTRELNAALQKEKDLVTMQKRFVSMASHEFRTPLSTIVLAAGFIKKYRNKLTAEEINKKLESVERQVNHMTYLLDDVLTIGKGEAGTIKVKLGTLQVKELVETLVADVTNSQGKSHKVNLRLKLDKATIQSDEGLIRNILINLLSNAIKYSPQAKQVNLFVTLEQDLEIRVQDFGLGIAPNDIERLFEPFFRGGNISAISGTGLGLSIVKKAIDLLGGTIKVSSKLGEGTEFLVKLPLL